MKELIMDSHYKPQVESCRPEKNNFQVGVDKIFQPKCIWPDAEDTASSN